ncbi:hypothetical protein KZ838_17765, partial [Pseudomonas aeruginosa]|uniref:hypothetical protein n=1 Tax=Pseudomonas aeruginosa TaxID=287 RepID=UPI001CA5E170
RKPWLCNMMLLRQFNNRVALSSCNRPLMTIPFIKPDLEVHIAAGPVRVFRTRSSPFAARRATTKRG